MTPWARGLAVGALFSASLAAAVTTWAVAEPETQLIIAARPIAQGSILTLPMLEARSVPTRFLSRRKLGVQSVAGVVGQQAPRSIPAGDFIDPTHFGARPDACALDARAQAPRFAVETPALEAFLRALPPSAAVP